MSDMLDDYKIQNGVWGLIYLALMFPIMFLRGLAIKLLWLWFIVPFGVPAIGLAWAVGLGILVVFITGAARVDTKRNRDEHDMKKMVTFSITTPIVAILMGLVFSFFV